MYLKKERQVDAEQRYKDRSKDKLRKAVHTKIRTTMIGALDRIEREFGGLWGQGRHPRELTPAEREMAEARERMRTEILNLGNSQIRAINSELDQYEVSWTRNTYEWTPEGITKNGKVL